MQATTSTEKEFAEHLRAKLRLRTQCERVRRTLSSSTQEEIDALFDDTEFSLELNNSKGPLERYSCDGGTDKRNFVMLFTFVVFLEVPLTKPIERQHSNHIGERANTRNVR